MAVFVLSLMLGLIGGLRSMMPLALVSLGARLQWIEVEGSALAFLGSAWAPWIFITLAIGELVTDQLPTTPSRLVPIQFGTRILTGAISGAALGTAASTPTVG